MKITIYKCDRCGKKLKHFLACDLVDHPCWKFVKEIRAAYIPNFELCENCFRELIARIGDYFDFMMITKRKK